MARTEEQQQQADDEDYSGNEGVKFQTEWLPIEGTVPEFFTHLIHAIEAYYLINTRSSCLIEYPGVPSGLFSSSQ